MLTLAQGARHSSQFGNRITNGPKSHGYLGDGRGRRPHRRVRRLVVDESQRLRMR